MSLKTAIGRVAYPKVAEPYKATEESKLRRSLMLVWGEEIDLSELKALIKKVADKTFPNGVPKGAKNPLKSAETLRRDDGTLPEGFKATDTIAEFWKYEKDGVPPFVDANPNNVILPSDVYSGMTGRVFCNASGYNHPLNKGVSLHLEAFQKAADGKPIGNAPVDPAAVFDAIGAGVGADAPTEAVNVEDLW